MDLSIARRAISFFEDGCIWHEPTVCFWIAAVINTMPVFMGGPPRVRAAAYTARLALRIVYGFYCGGWFKGPGSPLPLFEEFDESIFEGLSESEGEAILERIKAISEEGR